MSVSVPQAAERCCSTCFQSISLTGLYLHLKGCSTHTKPLNGCGAGDA